MYWMRSSAPLGRIRPLTRAPITSMSVVAAGLVLCAQGLHVVGLPPERGNAPGIFLRCVGLAHRPPCSSAMGGGKFLKIPAPSYLNETGACEFHPVAGLGIAQVFAALIVAAVMDLHRVAQPAGFMTALPQE